MNLVSIATVQATNNQAEYGASHTNDKERNADPPHDAHKTSIPSNCTDIIGSPSLHGAPRSSTIPELKFAVIGARRSGKTIFMQRALDLKRPSQSMTCCKKMSLEGRLFLITLIEVQLDESDISAEDNTEWSNPGGKFELSHVDGVLALYDVTKQESISRIPTLLSELIHSRASQCRLDHQITRLGTVL